MSLFARRLKGDYKLLSVESENFRIGDLVKINARYNPDNGKIGSIVSIYDNYTVEVDLGKNAMSNLFKVEDIEPATIVDVATNRTKPQIKKRWFALCKGYEGYELPLRKTRHSAGYDFVAPCNILIPAHSHSEAIMTGVKAYMQEDEVLNLYIRSSLAFKHGIILATCVSCIDSDYYNNPENEGNIGFRLYNTSDLPVLIKKDERVVQGVFVKYLVADNCNSNEIRKGGVGSTND